MFELQKTFRFEASHVLTHHDGKCSRLHGHSYEMTLIFRGQELQKEGPQKHMLIDFNDISKAVHPLIKSHLDHHFLNETLQTDSPTAEFIAVWIYNQLQSKFTSLYAVCIKETSSSSVTYCPSL